MIALLMCGGKGERLGMGEKPLVKVVDRRLVDHVLDNLIDFEVIAVTSNYTPKTEKYLKRQGIECFRARGIGFIEDYVEAVKELKICEPILIISSDLIIFKDRLIDEAISLFFRSEARALQTVSDKPLGMNIIDGYFIDVEQDEVVYRINADDAININTIDDLKKAERIWNMMSLKRKGRG